MLFGAAFALSLASTTMIRAQTPAPLVVKVGFLRQAHSKDTVSILDIPAPDDGFAGAKLAATDDNTTGSFLNQSYTVEDVPLKPGDDPVTALKTLVDHGVTLVLADLSAPDLLKIADAEHGKDVLIFNTSAPDDSLRQENCRRNIIHVAPSRAMLTDGLAEYLIWKQWPRWLLMKGSHPADELLAQAYERSAKKFGAKIVDTRTYLDTGGTRRSDSGSVQTQTIVPVTTQNAPAYDILIAADESEVFAGYLPYETWDPRPVAGLGGSRADKLVARSRAMGRRAIAEPFLCAEPSRHECARQQCLGRDAHDRRCGDADEHQRSAETSRLSRLAAIHHRRLQGREADGAALGSAVASADSVERWA